MARAKKKSAKKSAKSYRKPILDFNTRTGEVGYGYEQAYQQAKYDYHDIGDQLLVAKGAEKRELEKLYKKAKAKYHKLGNLLLKHNTRDERKSKRPSAKRAAANKAKRAGKPSKRKRRK